MKYMIKKRTKDMVCKLCGCDKITVTYEGKIRDGKAGNYTLYDEKIYRCLECGTMWHEAGENTEDFYESDEYRKSVDGTSDIENFYNMHDGESLDKFHYTGTTIYRNKIVADIGCGGGAFLDYINLVAKAIIAVEPSLKFREEMIKKNFIVYPYAKDALKDWKSKIDIVVSFDVIEHVDCPDLFIKEIFDLLAQGGRAVIGTPTDSPVMRELMGTCWESFLFCTQHKWVLCEESFNFIARKYNIQNYKCRYYQRYGLGNAFHWLNDKMPNQHSSYGFISETLDFVWRSELERQGKSDYIVFEIRK